MSDERGFRCRLAGEGVATDHAQALLGSLGVEVCREDGPADRHPAMAWAQSGAMALTGRPDGPPRMCPAPLASCVDGALAALRSLAGGGLPPLPDAALLGERAAIAGLRRQGRISAGGACHLLRAADGAMALSLPRADDWTLLPAWLECEPLDNWAVLADRLATRDCASLAARGRELGLALGLLDETDDAAAGWFEIQRCGHSRPPRRRPRVIDLSALWAGPLCAQLLGTLGAEVIKVESRQRPDGARRGPAHFHDLLNAGKASVLLDFADPGDLDHLRRLLVGADIVIEAARPRALRQLGIDAEAILAASPGLVWLSITGHGRPEPRGQWIAYGDDAGAAAGLSALLLESSGELLFGADAIADPLTAVHAALAAWQAHLAGGGTLLELNLRDVTRHCLRAGLPSTPEARRARCQDWEGMVVAAGLAECRPPPRRHPGPARPLGADTVAVLAGLRPPC